MQAGNTSHSIGEIVFIISIEVMFASKIIFIPREFGGLSDGPLRGVDN